jgi:dual oxidase maturation factor 1
MLYQAVGGVISAVACCRSAFATWLLMNLLLVVVPRYGAYAMMLTGTLLLGTDLAYYMLIPFNPLVVRFEGSVLMFRLGWCFWLVIIAGDTCFTRSQSSGLSPHVV